MLNGCPQAGGNVGTWCLKRRSNSSESLYVLGVQTLSDGDLVCGLYYRGELRTQIGELSRTTPNVLGFVEGVSWGFIHLVHIVYLGKRSGASYRLQLYVVMLWITSGYCYTRTPKSRDKFCLVHSLYDEDFEVLTIVIQRFSGKKATIVISHNAGAEHGAYFASPDRNCFRDLYTNMCILKLGTELLP